MVLIKKVIDIYKSCSKCGKIHDTKYKCNAGRIKKVLTNDMKLRNLNAWHIKAEEIKKKSNYLCAICKESNRYTYDRLEVHHIDKLRDNPDKLLDDYNLICLCKEHHRLADEGKIDKNHLIELAKYREGIPGGI